MAARSCGSPHLPHLHVIVIEGKDHAVYGRIIEVRLPERDRLSVEPTSEQASPPHPLGVIQLLTAVDLETGTSLRGFPVHPRIGQHVFSAHPRLIKQAVEGSELSESNKVHLAVFPHAQNTSVSIAPAHIFGRHCAVLGTTGGGKSWTLAHLVEEIARLGGKAILFDATGEYLGHGDGVERFHNPRMQRRLDAQDQAFRLLTQPTVETG